MIIIIDTEQGQCEISDATDLKRLSAELRGKGSIAAALGSLASVDADGEHIWCSIDRLRQCAAPPDASDWQERFDAMIAYAAGKGWTDAANENVRVHISQS